MDLHNKLNLLSFNCNGFKNKANIILDTYPIGLYNLYYFYIIIYIILFILL